MSRSAPFTRQISLSGTLPWCVAAILSVGLLGCSAPAEPKAPPRNPGASGTEFRVHFKRGLELSRQGLVEGALAEFEACSRIDPDVADLQFQIGRLQLEQARRGTRDPHDAIESLERSLELDPRHNDARLLLARIYKRRLPPGIHNPIRVSELYESFFEDNPHDVNLRLDYARWLSEGEVRLVLHEDPDRVSMDSNWSLELAQSHLEKILDTAPPDSEAVKLAQAYLAEVLMKMGDFEVARRRMEAVLEAYELPPAARAKALQKIGHCSYRLGEYDKAVASFKEAYLSDPRPEYLWDILIGYEKLGGYPPDFPPALRFRLAENFQDPPGPPAMTFTDAAGKLGVDKWAGAGPSAWADVDGDGLEDLLACGCDTFCTLWRNTGERFEDITLKAGLGKLESGFGAVFADYDNDGDLDFYVSRNGWNGPSPNSLMRNDGDGTFTDVIESSGAQAEGASFNAAWADFNRDGWLDLLVSQGVTSDGSRNRLFFNDGDGTFTDVTEKSGILEPVTMGTIGIAVGDYDLDGWPDIFVHGRVRENLLYHNEGDGTFRDVAREAGVAGPSNNAYIAYFKDMDADGDLDIFAASLAEWHNVLAGYQPGYRPRSPQELMETPRYWRNEGNGRFSDQTEAAGLIHPIGVMSGGMADLDNDGYPEIYLGTGNPKFSRLEPNILLRNIEGKRFVDITREAGVGGLGKGHGVTFNDWDRDGDLDIYIELGGFYHGDFWHSSFFINEPTAGNNWLEVTLEQPMPNSRAVGAGVTVRAGSFTPYQEVKAGEGFGSTNPPRLHFGLGKRGKLDALEIRWPDGSRETIPGPPVNRRITVAKGSGRWTGS